MLFVPERLWLLFYFILKFLIKQTVEFFEQNKILPLVKDAIEEFYGEEPKISKSYGRIINARHFKWAILVNFVTV